MLQNHLKEWERGQKHTTESTVFIRAISTILLSIAQGLGTCTVTILALELSQTAEAMRTHVWLIGTISAVFLSITFPPYGDTPAQR